MTTARRKILVLSLLLLATVAAAIALHLMPGPDRAGKMPGDGQRPLKL